MRLYAVTVIIGYTAVKYRLVPGLLKLVRYTDNVGLGYFLLTVSLGYLPTRT